MSRRTKKDKLSGYVQLGDGSIRRLDTAVHPRVPTLAKVNLIELQRPPIDTDHTLVASDNAENGSRARRRNLNAERTHCPAGHPYSGSNLLTAGVRKRRCRICTYASNKRWRDRQTAA